MSPPIRLHVVVLSFNRGPFLAHAVESITRCAPWARLTIVDDDSDDPGTVAILDQLASIHTVRRPADFGVRRVGDKHGGLHANMQAAFASMDDDEILCFLQDDMQLARRVEPEELASIVPVLRGERADEHGKRGRPRLAQPSFMKGIDRRRDARLVRFDPKLDAYLVDRFHRSAGAHYSDVCLGHVGALRAVDWSFVARESANERAARTRLAQMITLRNPFSAWLPDPPAYRGRRRTLALRIGERLRGCAFHPLRLMDEAERSALLDREPSVRPEAEAFLRTVGSARREPWTYVPIQGIAWLKWLHSIESRIQRLGRLVRR